ncbi:uncharacterized protein TNIN_59411 [Trichonephila inaurata madagascariensis]|uniref:Uncharacterized protein n=1 Tax=Trichonephila inaurata madagascariensis TaxID=2747483 RepID=A0A8X6YAH0_9ARAC|nr:uncharacterized protein TNIN_187931 [Trichonephila inaurata madagascariensis]GFY68532.1 uncharacterized protein TNIN_59411 [Trichonephila inaurata madagascariensis]
MIDIVLSPGLTKNYIIFLKCEVDVRMRTFDLTNESLIIIHMCPLSRLTIKKLSRRKLEILFPNGCTCFFKLPLSYGCGTSWAKWRNIENMCATNRNNLLERWTLVPYAELDEDVQNYFKVQMFLRSTHLIIKNILMHGRNCETIREDHLHMCHSVASSSHDALPITKKQISKDADKIKFHEKILEDKDDVFTYPSASIKSRRIKKDLLKDETIRDDHLHMCHPVDSASHDLLPITKKKITKDADKIKFYEKIFEDKDDVFSYPSASIKSRLIKKDLLKDDSDYDKEKIKLDKIYTEAARKEQKKSKYDSESKSQKERKGAKRTRLVRRFGEGIPEACIFDLSFSYEDSLIDEEHEDTSLDIRRSSWNRSKRLSPFDYLIEERVAENSITDEQKEDKDKDGNEKQKGMKPPQEIAALCPNFSSILFVPKGVWRSQSSDNLISIKPTFYKNEYLRTNISVPNLDEVLFHRRNNRLSYLSTFDESPDVGGNKSFWIPDSRTENDSGRIYCPNPMTQKFEAFQMKSKLYNFRTNTLSSEQKEDFSNDDSPRFYSEFSKDIKTHDSNEAQSKKLDLLDELLEDMEREYPLRHSLWTESPDMKTCKSPEQTDDGTKISKSFRDEESTSHKESSKRSKILNPQGMARGLKHIQQTLFAAMETGEIARFMFKPHTATEVNCPYLFGYLYFFERVKNLVVAELQAEKTASDMARVFCSFIQVLG